VNSGKEKQRSQPFKGDSEQRSRTGKFASSHHTAKNFFEHQSVLSRERVFSFWGEPERFGYCGKESGRVQTAIRFANLLRRVGIHEAQFGTLHPR
jgi:hypothetical protein